MIQRIVRKALWGLFFCFFWEFFCPYLDIRGLCGIIHCHLAFPAPPGNRSWYCSGESWADLMLASTIRTWPALHMVCVLTAVWHSRMQTSLWRTALRKRAGRWPTASILPHEDIRHGVCEDDLSGYAVEPGQYISSGGEKYPRTAACELRFIFPVFSGKRNSSGRKFKPNKAPVWRRNVLCGKFLGLADKTRQWGSVRGVWRSRPKEAHRVTVQDACKAARWKVTGWAGDSTDKSTQQKPPANESVIIIPASLLNKWIKSLLYLWTIKKVIKLTYGYWK